jgi:hypothetical protein
VVVTERSTGLQEETPPRLNASALPCPGAPSLGDHDAALLVVMQVPNAGRGEGAGGRAGEQGGLGLAPGCVATVLLRARGARGKGEAPACRPHTKAAPSPGTAPAMVCALCSAAAVVYVHGTAGARTGGGAGVGEGGSVAREVCTAPLHVTAAGGHGDGLGAWVSGLAQAPLAAPPAMAMAAMAKMSMLGLSCAMEEEEEAPSLPP